MDSHVKLICCRIPENYYFKNSANPIESWETEKMHLRDKLAQIITKHARRILGKTFEKIFKPPLERRAS